MAWRASRACGRSRAPASIALKETPPNTVARRPCPVGACSDAELAEHIRQQIAASRLHGEGYRKLWALLRFAGVRARRVRRVMRENSLLAPHRVGRTEAKPHDGTIITDKFNEMWGTRQSEVVGIHASRSANRFEALEPVRQGVHCCRAGGGACAERAPCIGYPRVAQGATAGGTETMVAPDAVPLMAAFRAKAPLAAMIGSFAVFTTNLMKLRSLAVSTADALET
jgi:hypothetical protein